MLLSKFLVKQKMAPVLHHTARMNMVFFKDDQFKDKGRGEESAYFNKKDRELLQGLLKKMETQAAKAKKASYGSSSDEEGKFLNIFNYAFH